MKSNASSYRGDITRGRVFLDWSRNDTLILSREKDLGSFILLIFVYPITLPDNIICYSVSSLLKWNTVLIVFNYFFYECEALT
mmetsp:Transcript_16693/g.19048  ORF Transcript_16693/g.19048 Transcript_16693/m.19048 type:complete len:83 (-) Transcript_16693:175-423(-)